MKLEAYLNFDGQAEKAINFYKNALGAEVEMLMRFKDSPEPAPPGTVQPGNENKVMHASLRIGETRLLLADGRCKGSTDFRGFSIALSVETEAQADRAFAALQSGGQVTMPLGKTFFSPKFGMLKDRFGVHWMILVAHRPS
jgi:PhnB protein